MTRLATRGSSQSVTGSWVTSYRLQYSDDGFMFHFYQEPRDISAKVYQDFLCAQKWFSFAFVFQSIFLFFFHVQVFSGNRDAISVVYNKLSQPITTHFVRILPVQWNNYVSMAVEIYGCQGIYVDLLIKMQTEIQVDTSTNFKLDRSQSPVFPWERRCRSFSSWAAILVSWCERNWGKKKIALRYLRAFCSLPSFARIKGPSWRPVELNDRDLRSISRKNKGLWTV